MTNFGVINDNYYQPAEDTAWDYFVDWCEENGFDPEAEDFEQWKEDQREMAEEIAAERWADAQREDSWDWD